MTGCYKSLTAVPELDSPSSSHFELNISSCHRFHSLPPAERLLKETPEAVGVVTPLHKNLKLNNNSLILWVMKHGG